MRKAVRGPGARDGAPRWGGADSAALPAAEAAELRERLRGVKHIVVVLSGKGGVGKSTFSALLARGLAADEGKQVGRDRLSTYCAAVCAAGLCIESPAVQARFHGPSLLCVPGCSAGRRHLWAVHP